MKLPTEEDIYICDCISSESLINPSSPTYKRFVAEEEVKLWAKWKKKMRRKKGRQASKKGKVLKEVKEIKEEPPDGKGKKPEGGENGQDPKAKGGRPKEIAKKGGDPKPDKGAQMMEEFNKLTVNPESQRIVDETSEPPEVSQLGPGDLSKNDSVSTSKKCTPSKASIPPPQKPSKPQTKTNTSKQQPTDPPIEELPPQARFVYSKMKGQISPEFRSYIDNRIREIVKNDSNISIDCGLRCLNRMICTECEIKSCPVGGLCQNRRFQKQENKLVYPKMTHDKGWGLFAKETIRKGDFIIQYLGEIFSLTSQIGIKRRTEYSGSTCTYLMKLSPKEVIDPTKKGNVARFINHSCDPNCVTQKWNVMGEVFVGIFAKKDIHIDQELSFDYKFDVYKTPFLECFCRAYNCKGYLGLAGGNPNLRLHTVPPPPKRGAAKKNDPKPGIIELMSNKKSKKKSTFIIKKSHTPNQSKDLTDLDFHIRPKKKRLIFDEKEDEDDEKILKNLRKSTKQRKQKLNANLTKSSNLENEGDPLQPDPSFRLNEKDVCEICKKSIYFDSDSDNLERTEEMERKLNHESIPCTNCPANYHISCLQERICGKCGNDFVLEGVNQIDLVAGNIRIEGGVSSVKQTPMNTAKKRLSTASKKVGLVSEVSVEVKKSEDSKLDSNKSIDSDNLDWVSQSGIDRSGVKARRESTDSRLRKGSENLSICFTNSKADFRTKKKQQFKMISDSIISIFDKDLAASDFQKTYFDSKNKLKPLSSGESEPSSDFSNFYISPIELAVFKQRGTRIFLKHTQIHVFWNNSDISYKNFFARNTELRCGCRPEEKDFVKDLLSYIQRCVVTYRETSGTVENTFQIPAIFLKQVLGEYYRNSKYVEKEFGVKLSYDRLHVTDECYPIHFLTTLRLRGRSQNIKRAHGYIVAQLKPLVARRKYMTREDIKIIISKLQQIKRNINPTEIRCCRDNALRDINHPFYTIYYKDKEVAFIGTKDQVMRAEKFVSQIIESNRRLEDNPLGLNFLVPGGEKAELIHIKNKAEKKFPGNRMIIYDSLPPKRNSSLTLISSYRKFEDFVR